MRVRSIIFFFYLLPVLFASCLDVFVHIYFPPWRALPVALLTTRISLSRTCLFLFLLFSSVYVVFFLVETVISPQTVFIYPRPTLNGRRLSNFPTLLYFFTFFFPSHSFTLHSPSSLLQCLIVTNVTVVVVLLILIAPFVVTLMNRLVVYVSE